MLPTDMSESTFSRVNFLAGDYWISANGKEDGEEERVRVEEGDEGIEVVVRGKGRGGREK